MKRKIIWLTVSSLMALSLVIASCGPAVVEEEEEEEEEVVVIEEEEEEEVVVEEEVPQYGGVLTEVHTSEVRGWDDAITPHYQMWNRSPVGQRLLIGDWTKGPAGSGELDFYISNALFNTKMGQVAESWEVFEEGRIVYKIRQGIHYALNPDSEASRLLGGRELTAEDVAYSLSRLFTTPGSYHLASAPTVARDIKITALDKYTLEIDINPAEAYQANYMSAFQAYSDTPPEVIEKYGDLNDWRNVVGAGPFMLTDYVAGSSLTYTRNPNYFMKDPCGPGKGNQLPYVDGIKTLIILDTSTLLAALRTGKIDYHVNASWDDGQSLLLTSPQLEYKRGHTPGTSVIYMRTDKEELPYDDIRVRQALMMATDYNSIIDATMGGLGIIPSWPLVYQTELADFYIPLEDLDERTRELYTYNPEKAKQLLAEAGYPDGFKAELIVNSSPPYYVEEVSMFAAMWAKVGVELKLKPKESGAMAGIQRKRSHSDMIYGSSGNTGLAWLRMMTVRGENLFNLSMIDEEYVETGRLAMGEAWLRGDTEEWQRIGKEDILVRLLWEAWGIPLPQKPTFVFWWPWLKNFYGAAAPGAFEGHPFQYVWIDQELKKAMGY